jgi:hypothetical protein
MAQSWDPGGERLLPLLDLLVSSNHVDKNLEMRNKAT